ncbi:DNRLRE domain-containing protein [Amycolatopsis halotolerans]|uniref:DNRLRE domain-containing protein n=1 Tax=Amycolatopsis halotolerans TaxID=330083 RepID=A0ABV7QEK6_9PSEU
MPEAKRLAEKVDQRTLTTKAFPLSDGRTQLQVSQTPLHYRDAAGHWQDIDTRIEKTSAPQGFAYRNEHNTFHSSFGEKTDHLVGFKQGEREIRLGIAGESRSLEPRVEGAAITYPGAFPGTDVVYQVTPDALKEKLVLAKPPAQAPTYSFTMDLAGVEAEQQKDGSIAFFRAGGDRDGGPLFVMAKPFMLDGRDDAASPYGKSWSGKVAQTVRAEGNRFTITVTADQEWLRAKERVYPVVIDPTIKIQPTATQAQDTMVTSDEPDANHDGSWRLSVGATNSGAARSLLKFDLANIPAGTRLDSAQLQVYYDQDHTTGANDVTVEAHRATQPWTASTATWNSAAAAFAEVGQNQDSVDDGEPGRTAANGEWRTVDTGDAEQAVGHSYRVASRGGDYTWVPRLTEDGDYQVEVHYVPGANRASGAPYTVFYNGGQQTVPVDQTASAPGGWKSLGAWPFKAGTGHKVVLGGVPGKEVVADAVRLTKPGTQVKKADKANVWHSFSVRSTVQSWLDGTQPNHGFLLKAADETRGMGGPRYEAAEYAYNGATEQTPRLLLTYGKPGPALDAPTTIRATGANLTWSAYPGNDLVEYQVHRSVFQQFTPTAATLVAPLRPGTASYADTTAQPTKADDPQPFGNAFYYVVAAKTRDGQLIPSATQLVRLPKAGQVVKVLQGNAADTTLASKQPDQPHDKLTGEPWLSVGNNSGTFGATRGVVKFPDLGGIPSGARVQNAELSLWGFTYVGGTPVGTGSYEAHGLTKDFDQGSATWNKASAGRAWSTPGGDFDPAVAGTTTGVTNDPALRVLGVTGLAQRWVNDPASNHGALVKLADEANPQERTLFLSSEAAEPRLRPKLTVVYTEQTAENTYYAPTTPDRMIPGDEYTVPVTLTNTTGAAWPAADYALSYHWELPDGTDVTGPGNRVETPLPKDLAPDGVLAVDAKVKTATPFDLGNKREAFVLKWDLRNRTTGKWLSETTKIPSLAQNITIDDPKSDQLGLEKFYSYSGGNTGAGSTLMVNQFAGNAVWSYNALSNPSRGLATFLRMTYNAQDTSNSYIGSGWSLSASTLARLGTPLEFYGWGGAGYPAKIVLTDGDGTSHQFALNKHDSPDPRLWDYDKPAGVHLYLQRTGSSDPNRTWVMTRPDRTQLVFDSDGYQSATVDKNGNELQFTYERSCVNNHNTGVLKYLTDATGRRTLNFEYFQNGDPDYDYFTGDKKHHGVNLANGKIANQLKAITDISGRRIEFVYSDRGLLQEITDGAGTDQHKTFTFFYNNALLNKNAKLISVTDPRGNSTGLSYYDDPARKWKTRTLTNRAGKDTGFDYRYPDPDHSSAVDSIVTDANGHASDTLIDGYGRPTKLTNAKNQTTELTWDADNNVRRLAENGGKAVATWEYDPVTGYPKSIADAEANANKTPPTALNYRTGLGGRVADLTEKITPEGRKWLFTYDDRGNLVAVTDPKGSGDPASGHYTTLSSYDSYGQLLTVTDANNNTTTFGDYDPIGSPRRITDAYGHDTLTKFDATGNVLSTMDARKKVSEYTYDLFGRPLSSKAPKDADKGDFIFTPGAQYDSNDNVVKTTAANGAVTSAAYRPTDEIAAVSAPKDDAGDPDKTTTYDYDNVGNLLRQTDPKGTLTPDPGDFTTTREYDQLNRVIATVDASGNRATYDYDNVGNLTTVVDPRKTATHDPKAYTTKYAYDLNHRVKTVTDAAGFTTGRKYDRDGNIVEATDAEQNTSVLKLDARAMVEEQWVPRAKDASGNPVYRKTRFEYDEVGNKTKIISPRGTEIAGNTDNFAAVTVYDKLNRPIEQQTPFDVNDERVKTPDKTTYTYDEVGRLTEVSAPPSSGQNFRNVTRTSYFDTGWLRSSVDPWNITTTYDYDQLGKQTARTLTAAGGSMSRTMAWSFYPDGKLKSRSDDGVPIGRDVRVIDNSDPGAIVTGTWGTGGADPNPDYEGFDYRRHNPGTGTDTVAWNLDAPRTGTYEIFVRYPKAATATNATYTIDHDGATTTKTVDQTQQPGQWVSLGSYGLTEGQPRKVTLSDKANGVVAADAVKIVRDGSGETGPAQQKTFGYRYDPNNNLVDITDSSPNAKIDNYAIAYNGLNQIQQVQEKLKGAVAKTTSYSYDPNGNPKTRDHDDQHSVYEYDVRDLVEKVTNTDTGGTPQNTTYTYTPRAQKLLETKANGNQLQSEYFPDGALRHEVERKPDGTIVSEHTRDYDANGNPAHDTQHTMNADNHGAYLDNTRTFAYDPRDRLRSSTKTEPSGATLGVEKYLHDANNNVIEQTIDGKATKYTYDRNRLVTSSIDKNTSTHTYDPFGRLDSVTDGGTLLEKYRYDGFDRIAEYQKLKEGSATERVTTTYAYDPLDRTLAKTEGGKTTDFAYLGLSSNVLNEKLAGKLDKSYQYSPNGQRLSQTKQNADGGKETTQYGYNPHTDVETLTTDKGDTKATYGYTAYGSDDKQSFTGIDKPKPQDPSAQAYNLYRFNGKRYDPVTRNYDMGFRHYSPGRNTFLTRDSYNGAVDDLGLSADPWTGNRYAFTGGNPIGRVEIDGHKPCGSASDCQQYDQYLQQSNQYYDASGVEKPQTPAMRKNQEDYRQQRQVGSYEPPPGLSESDLGALTGRANQILAGLNAAQGPGSELDLYWRGAYAALSACMDLYKSGQCSTKYYQALEDDHFAIVKAAQFNHQGMSVSDSLLAGLAAAAAAGAPMGGSSGGLESSESGLAYGQYRRIFSTDVGDVAVTATAEAVESSGVKTLELSDFVVYSKGGRDLRNRGGVELVHRGLKTIFSDAHEAGFDQVRIQGLRVTGGNPGRMFDETWDVRTGGRIGGGRR